MNTVAHDMRLAGLNKSASITHTHILKVTSRKSLQALEKILSATQDEFVIFGDEKLSIPQKVSFRNKNKPIGLFSMANSNTASLNHISAINISYANMGKLASHCILQDIAIRKVAGRVEFKIKSSDILARKSAPNPVLKTASQVK